MSRVRIYEIARDLELSTREILAFLAELGVEVKSHSSTVDEATAQALTELVQESRKPKRKRAREPAKKQAVEVTGPPAPLPPEAVVAVAPVPPLTLEESTPVRALAQSLGVAAEDLVGELIGLGIMKSVTQLLTLEEASLAAAMHGRQVERSQPVAAPAAEVRVPEAKPGRFIPVPPVVSVMGHVDHGKTTLLDAVRNTNVVAGEFGGITQHIGASEVEYQGKRIVFLDTPGHEAFTEMRARGAKVTDLACLVVAADDGVQPQTVEAVEHARAAGVPIVVAINKIDKEGAGPDQVRQQLATLGLVPEEWGGDTVMVEVSAKQRIGLDHLLEMLLLVHEVREAKAPVDVPAAGVVVESRLDSSRGPVATVLVKQGRLRKGDAVLAGEAWGRLRKMTNWLGKELDFALPGTPVEVCGLSQVPPAGSSWEVLPSHKQAKLVAKELADERRRGRRTHIERPSFEDFLARIRAGEVKTLRLILKTDTQGSLEAVSQAILRLRHPEIGVELVHSAVGTISESDVHLASAAGAIVLGFHARPDLAVEQMAKQEDILIRRHTVIYQLVDDVRSLMEGMLAPVYADVFIGRAEVRRLFRSSRLGVIAGCYVLEGRVARGAEIRVVRGGEAVYQGTLDSLRHLKDDVREVQEGFECGIVAQGFNNFVEGDQIEVYERQVVARTIG